jgi:hypothetical protein
MPPDSSRPAANAAASPSYCCSGVRSNERPLQNLINDLLDLFVAEGRAEQDAVQDTVDTAAPLIWHLLGSQGSGAVAGSFQGGQERGADTVVLELAEGGGCRTAG